MVQAVAVASFGPLAPKRMEAWPALLRATVSGALFAALTLLSMLAPLTVGDGNIMDARNTLVALAAAFAGPLAGAMAAVPAGIYRLELGGAGAPSAIYAFALEVVLGRAKPISTIDDAVRTTALVEAEKRSLETGQAVTVG